jgi:hypothetical protein
VYVPPFPSAEDTDTSKKNRRKSTAEKAQSNRDSAKSEESPGVKNQHDSSLTPKADAEGQNSHRE